MQLSSNIGPQINCVQHPTCEIRWVKRRNEDGEPEMILQQKFISGIGEGFWQDVQCVDEDWP